MQNLLDRADRWTTSIYTYVGDKWKNNPGLKSGMNVFKPSVTEEIIES